MTNNPNKNIKPSISQQSFYEFQPLPTLLTQELFFNKKMPKTQKNHFQQV